MTVTNQTETRQIKVLRTPLCDFPDVIIHATETSVKKHPRYKEAKSGDSEAAFELVQATINDEQVENLRLLLSDRKPLLATGREGLLERVE